MRTFTRFWRSDNTTLMSRVEPLALRIGSAAYNSPENGYDWPGGYVGAVDPFGISSPAKFLFVSPTGTGTDCAYGSECSLATANAGVLPGQTVVMKTGVYAGLDINATHLKAVTTGQVHGACRPLRIGRTVHFWAIDIFNDEGDQTCASVNAVLYILKSS